MSDVSVGAAGLRLLAVGGLQTALQLLIDEFAREGGARVEGTFTSPANLNTVIAGAQFDVVVAAAPWVEEIDATGALQPGSRRKAARVGIGVAVREGAPKPDLSTAASFDKAIRAARNIVYTDPATPNGSGIVTMRILAAAGLLDVVKAKGKQQNLGPGRELVAKGEYELGLFNLSEIRVAGVAGIDIAGPVPAPLQDYTRYEGAVFAGSTSKAAAASFLDFVTGKSAAALWKAGNAEPA